MYLLQATQSFDWKILLLGEEEWSFLPEVILRSVIMFIVAVLGLRLIGRRGVMQGVFQISTIITLGSAAGDPMFYKKVGILPAMFVFATIVFMYRLVNFVIAKFQSLEHIIEGSEIRLVEDQRFAIENFSDDSLSKDEIFADLRLNGVSHLGQVDAAYIEPSGEMSIFFLPDNEVSYGLPVRPDLFKKQIHNITKPGMYSCAFCGFTEEIKVTKKHICKICKKKEWVQSLSQKRIK